MRDEQADVCSCIRCRGGKPMLHIVAASDAPIVQKAAAIGLRSIYEPHEIPKEIVEAARRADIRLAAVRGGA